MTEKYIALSTLMDWSHNIRFLSSDQVKEAFLRMPAEKVVSKDKLLQELEYSSKWNNPCPEWVYNVVRNS